MKKKCKVLIIDDHLMIIDGYKNAIKFGLSASAYNLEIDIAVDCDGAIDKVTKSSGLTPYNLVILDLSLPPSQKTTLKYGEDLGVWIKSVLPDVKIIVVTGYDDNLRINSVIENINPIGFLLKKDISSSDLISAVQDVLNDKPYYSKTVANHLRNRNSFGLSLDAVSTQILIEISNGTRTKDLDNYIPLSKSSIEKKKRALKILFKVEKDRELILQAKEKGFI